MRGTLLAAASAVAFYCSPAVAADLPMKAGPAGCVQAVDGVNGKLASLGGSYAKESIYGGAASAAIPLGCEWGAQFDANAFSFDEQFLGEIAGHIFWRDPSRGLLGAYGSYARLNEAGGVSAAHVGPEFESYLGRWTLQGVAGVEFGNSTSRTAGATTSNFDVATRFFDQINLAYYLTDDFKVYIGHRYLGGDNAAAFGAEWGIHSGGGVMAALFAEGRVGEHDSSGVFGGIRIYFGQRDKTLIRRHREDDPTNWNSGFGAVNSGGPKTAGCPLGQTFSNGLCGFTPTPIDPNPGDFTPVEPG